MMSGLRLENGKVDWLRVVPAVLSAALAAFIAAISFAFYVGGLWEPPAAKQERIDRTLTPVKDRIERFEGRQENFNAEIRQAMRDLRRDMIHLALESSKAAPQPETE